MEHLIDHVYVSQKMTVATDVTDCYYSDHDHVLCAMTIYIQHLLNNIAMK